MKRRRVVHKKPVTTAGNGGCLDFSGVMVAEVADAAKKSADALKFVAESSGVCVGDTIAFSRSDLDRVEQIYRNLAGRQNGFVVISKLDFEYQMGLFLGEVIRTTLGGEWSLYQGRFHCSKPVVVRLSSGNFVDPFDFCAELSGKSVAGFLASTTLSQFVEGVDKLSFPA
ncbi:MAG: hypothetical protein NT069_20125 [Planctomycetota bacterium]|nr:hypothetical protein [Planctomycetota bacterium]